MSTRTAWLVVTLALVVAIVLICLTLRESGSDPDVGPRFKATTDVEAAHRCLADHFKYFVRDRADSAFCRNYSFGESGDGTDAEAYLRGEMRLP